MKSPKCLVIFLIISLVLSIFVLTSCSNNEEDENSGINNDSAEDASSSESPETPRNESSYPDKESTQEPEENNKRMKNSGDSQKFVKEPLPASNKRSDVWLYLLLLLILALLLIQFKLVLGIRNRKTTNLLMKIDDRLNEILRNIATYKPSITSQGSVNNKEAEHSLTDISKKLDTLRESIYKSSNQNGLIANLNQIFERSNANVTSFIRADLNRTLQMIEIYAAQLEEKYSISGDRIDKLQQACDKILNILDAQNDSRFQKLRIYFRDVSQDLQNACIANEIRDPDFKANLGEYVENFSKLVNLQKLSGFPSELEKAYAALKDIFKNYPVFWVFPKPGDKFDPDTMEQHKHVGSNEKVQSVLIPGIEYGDIKRKALVDVG